MFKLLSLIMAAGLAASACSAGTGTSGTSAQSAAKPAAKVAAADQMQANAANAPKPVLDAIHQLAPKAQIQSIEKSALPGMYQVIAQGQVVYISADGDYMLQGSVYDLKTHTDLSDAKMDQLRRAALARLSPQQMIVFAPPHPKYRITVFTDLDCPFCRQFHAHIADYNKAGIAVDYLFWPRTGLDTPSAAKAVSVWCAADRKSAFTAAKAGVDPKPATCVNPVKHDFELGIDLGVDGTPTIIADNGVVVGGYADPQELLYRLRKAHAPTAGG